MFYKLSVIFCFIYCTNARMENQWEIAVVTEDRIELLLSNGSLAGEPFGRFNEFTKLKALTFDNLRHQFVVSDMDQENDTIFSVQLTKETDINPIIGNLPDDIQGLAIDPISDILYWTNSINKTINYIYLNESNNNEPNILFKFQDANPQDITIDVCHQYIYWTNSDIKKPTIERAKIGSTNQEIIIEDDLHRPAGISVDYQTQKLFWADIKEGIYYTIESANLDGKDRRIIYEGTHSKPFGLAINSEFVYWTDINNNALWQLDKFSPNPCPIIIRHFQDKPMGLIVKNDEITTLPDCQALSTIVFPTTEIYKEQPKEIICLHGGTLTDSNTCKCLKGYVGEFCEISLCHNFCVHGQCSTSSLGYPKCQCFNGFHGKRCEKDRCEGYCQNDGQCFRDETSGGKPKCYCKDGFGGEQCEIVGDVCQIFCQLKQTDVLRTEKEILCRCVDGGSVQSNYSSLSLQSEEKSPLFMDHFQDTAFLTLSCLVLILFVAVITLAIYSCSLRKRPRIKKRIIVNKNVTPLTYRPQPSTEQCEITIENCCNMNICETPCFEPPKLLCLNKNDDKKKLLPNMENGEDMY